jgi:menaquinone-dependent protoporphyrinogen oxidase
MSARILIVYGTSYGQTAKVARFVADALTASGDSVTLVDAAELGRGCELPRGLSPRDFDGVIVAASVVYGRHQRSVRRFVGVHHEALNAVPSAFVSVSGSAGSRDVAKFAEALKVAGDFVRTSGWRPTLVESVAGAMAYTKYSPFLRWMMRRIAAGQGGPTDTRRDHEMTDWAQVRRFAEAFAATVPRAAAAPLSCPPTPDGASLAVR